MIMPWGKILSAAAAAAMLTGLPTAPAQAITYGSPDCEDNSLDLNCGNTNVVSLAGVVVQEYQEFTTYQLQTFCSGSLLRKEEDRVLILTAGHCAQIWMRGLQEGWLQDVGVSFKASVSDRLITHYALGGKPLLNRRYGPSAISFNLYHDYAVVEFPASGGNLANFLGQTIDLSQVSPVTLPAESYLLGIISATNPPLLTNVGYGISEWLNGPKTGGNKGGLVLKRPYGERYLSEFSATFGTLMPDASIAIASMNPARGYEGTCNGDSGGPNFHVANGSKIQVGVSSSGDRYCRATSLIARLDIPAAISFLSCAANATTPQAYSACGCTTLNRKWLCPR
jgi:hypothetical protein